MEYYNFNDNDFKKILYLSKVDPELLAKTRIQLIDEIIENADKENRIKLQRMQFRIDSIIRRSKNQDEVVDEINKLLLQNLNSLVKQMEIIEEKLSNDEP